MKRILGIVGCLIVALSFTTSSQAMDVTDEDEIQRQIKEAIEEIEKPDISLEDARIIMERTNAAEEKLAEYEALWKTKYPIDEEYLHDYLCSLREWLFDYDIPGVESYFVHDNYLYVNFAEDDPGVDFLYQPQMTEINLK